MQARYQSNSLLSLFPSLKINHPFKPVVHVQGREVSVSRPDNRMNMTHKVIETFYKLKERG